MPDPKLLEFSVQSFTADKLELKVKNISTKVLERTLAIELYIPTYLANSKVNEAAKAAAKNKKPVGVASLAGVVSGPQSWSVWAKRESTDASVVILLLNDLTQTGTELATPITVAAGAEFVISIPLNPQASRAPVHVLYSYLHGTDQDDQRGDGTLELKADSEPTPNVTLTTTAKNPTAIPAMNLVKVFWHVENGVSATLRGPLPGGNAELTLSSDPNAEFKIADGFIEIRVVSGMTFILQAEVKREGKPNLQVVRMLSLDTKNDKYTYLLPRPVRVLPYGLIEIDWAAWGVEEVQISVGRHTTRTIELTQQTLGRFYEGSGVMRVSATKEINGVKTLTESLTLEAPPEDSKTRSVEVISWIRMQKPNIQDGAKGLAVIAPKMAVLNDVGMYITDVGNADRTPPLEKLDFTLKAQLGAVMMWLALTAVDQRFICLRLVVANNTPDLEVIPFTRDGNPDEIPPVTLPPEVRQFAGGFKPVFDFVGFGGRAYVAVETAKPAGTARIAYSVAFDSSTKKADVRREPLLESLFGYRLVSFDNGLFALNRNTGQMFRFDPSKTGTLEPPKKAASAIKKGEGGAQDQSMVKDGLLVPVGRLLVVMSPTSVPSVDSLERFGLVNTLNYTSTTSANVDNLPQDLVYNPQKDYWSRCGHDLDVAPKAVAAYRGGDSKRLWVVQPDNDLLTLTVGSETLFAHDYVREFPTKPLPPYLNKTRKFAITNSTGMKFIGLSDAFHNAGLNDFGVSGPAELMSPLPESFKSGSTETFEFKYNDAEPAPITLRFQVEPAPGVRHMYFLEITFSGPDLGRATSVFKRVKGDARNPFMVAEIPGTTVQHTTNNPIVIPAPKVLTEGVTLRVHNHTSYGIWKETPEASDRFERSNRYSGEEIRVTYNTPAFEFMAYGAGELYVEVDFALPPGLETSAGTEPQRQLLRINTDKSDALEAEILPPTSVTSFSCRLIYLRKADLRFMYIGDGMARERGESIYLPVGANNAAVFMRVLKINPEDLSFAQGEIFQTKSNESYNVFVPPNGVALSNELVFAMFADRQVQVLDFNLQLQDKVSVDDFTVITCIESQYDGHYFMLGMKQENAKASYKLASRIISKANSGPKKIMTGVGRTVSLDAVKGFRDQNKVPGSPAWVSSKTTSPIAVSPSLVSTSGERGREVAVCVDGGLFVVGNTEQSIRTLAIEAAGREEDVVFGRDGSQIYCLHSESDNINLRLSRVDNKAWKQTHSLVLQTGQKAPDMAIENPQHRQTPIAKPHRSISMVRTLDDKFIFVSHGRTIFKIDVPSMKLIDSYKMELPCRVFHVWAGQPTRDSHPTYGSPSSCILLYAIGSTYTGDGMQGTNFKTHLYKLGIPDR